jgi:hypothetical protein
VATSLVPSALKQTLPKKQSVTCAAAGISDDSAIFHTFNVLSVEQDAAKSRFTGFKATDNILPECKFSRRSSYPASAHQTIIPRKRSD